jgi:dipicolinate synthase subunit B
MSFNACSIDTRFGKASDFVSEITKICSREPIITIADAEPLGPKTPLDALVVCPCTGNTLAKLAQGITDTPVTMAVKAHMRQSRPLLIALATNDGMSANLKNISSLLEKKSVYFVPMKQDDVLKKPHSLVAELEMLPECLSDALEGKQKRPLFL